MADCLILGEEAAGDGTCAGILERAGHTVRRAATVESAARAYRERRPDVTLLPLRLREMSWSELVARLRAGEPVPNAQPAVVLLCRPSDVALAVRAVREGASDFVTTPAEPEHLALVLDRLAERSRGQQLAVWLDRVRERGGGIAIGSSPRIRDLATQVELIAASDHTTVLLSGEGGTGKGSVAALVHSRSPRAHRPFVEVRCAARSAESIERELFGADEAARGRVQPALVEVASGGTLFLDEVGELPASTQRTLLALLEGAALRRTGAGRDAASGVRIIAATSRDLVAEVNAGRFREELYYRLAVMLLPLPPLRARGRDELVELITRLLDDLSTQIPGAPREPSEPALDCLLRHAWPGNIRELRNVLERAMILSRGEARLEVGVLPPEVRAAPATWEGECAEVRTLDEVERRHIERTLRSHQGNRTRAARELGISRATLIKKIRDYALQATP